MTHHGPRACHGRSDLIKACARRRRGCAAPCRGRERRRRPPSRPRPAAAPPGCRGRSNRPETRPGRPLRGAEGCHSVGVEDADGQGQRAGDAARRRKEAQEHQLPAARCQAAGFGGRGRGSVAGRGGGGGGDGGGEWGSVDLRLIPMHPALHGLYLGVADGGRHALALYAAEARPRHDPRRERRRYRPRHHDAVGHLPPAPPPSSRQPAATSTV